MFHYEGSYLSKHICFHIFFVYMGVRTILFELAHSIFTVISVDFLVSFLLLFSLHSYIIHTFYCDAFSDSDKGRKGNKWKKLKETRRNQKKQEETRSLFLPIQVFPSFRHSIIYHFIIPLLHNSIFLSIHLVVFCLCQLDIYWKSQ